MVSRDVIIEEQDMGRAHGTLIHGPVHPAVPLSQRKEERERSGDYMN